MNENSILVIRGAGPVGWPGSAEVVNMQPSDDLIKKGEIGIVYPTYNSARKAFGLSEDIVDASTGLQLPQKLGEQAYTVPISGMFTTKTIADGLIRGAANTKRSISKNIY